MTVLHNRNITCEQNFIYVVRGVTVTLNDENHNAVISIPFYDSENSILLYFFPLLFLIPPPTSGPFPCAILAIAAILAFSSFCFSWNASINYIKPLSSSSSSFFSPFACFNGFSFPPCKLNCVKCINVAVSLISKVWCL